MRCIARPADIRCKVCRDKIEPQHARPVIFLRNNFFLCGAQACNEIILQEIVNKL